MFAPSRTKARTTLLDEEDGSSSSSSLHSPPPILLIDDDEEQKPLLLFVEGRRRSLDDDDDGDSGGAALLGKRRTTTKQRVLVVFAVACVFLPLMMIVYNGTTTNAKMSAKMQQQKLGASPLTMRNLHELFDASNADSGDPIVAALKRDDLFDIRTFPERTSEYDGDLHDQKGADDAWYHKPIEGIRGKNKGKFKMCLMGGMASWDLVYVDNAETLTEPGLCFNEIVDADTKEKPGGFDDCDVRVFNQGAFLWGNRYIDPTTKGDEIKVFKPPPKMNPNQVDFYYAHEAANHFGKELADPRSIANMDYMGTFAMKENAIWYGFGPSVEQLIGNFQSFKIPREERVPSVAYLGLDCMPSRAGILNEISKIFPVTSIGGCANNFEKPEGDPGRDGSPKAQNAYLAPFMFYFSVENGIQCPDYITEKMWGALSRGSIPVYYGWDGIEEYLPSKDAFIDLRDYPTPETLATKLRHVATDDDAYNQMHAWRYQDPNTWPLAFRNLIREVSDDMKGSICNVLKAGPSPNHPRAKVQGFCADGSHSVEEFHDGTGLETALLFGKKVGSFQYSLKSEPDHPDAIVIGDWQRFMEKTCDELSGKCYHLKGDDAFHFVKPESESDSEQQQQQQQQGFEGDRIAEVIAIEPVLAMEEDCVPGVPTPGVDNCHNKEEQVGNAVTEEVERTQQPAAFVTKPNCNPARPCIAGVPVPGIGCCTEEERAIYMRPEAQEHKPVAVLAVPLSAHQKEEQEARRRQRQQEQEQQEQQEQQDAVVIPQPGVDSSADVQEVPKPKELAVPLDCNPDPACQPLKEITPGVMDCCAKTVSLDYSATQDAAVEQQLAVVAPVVVPPEAAAIISPEMKDMEANLEEEQETVRKIEKELEDAKQALKAQEESISISGVEEEAQQQQQRTPQGDLPSEADAKFEARVFEWGPGHESVSNDV